VKEAEEGSWPRAAPERNWPAPTEPCSGDGAIAPESRASAASSGGGGWPLWTPIVSGMRRVAAGSPLLPALRLRFGEAILGEGGEVRRGALAEIVFETVRP